MRKKPKFNKKRCAKCIYHTRLSGAFQTTINGKPECIMCNYACDTGSTCLKPLDSHTSYDLRGGDYDNCLLFIEGEAIDGRKSIGRIYKRGEV